MYSRSAPWLLREKPKLFHASQDSRSNSQCEIEDLPYHSQYLLHLFHLLDDQIACWIKRPIVVYADEFTVDSTRGQVTEPFKMVIPRLSKYGDQPVFVTPFTTLLTELIIEAKREV